jgi:hypothetical protein
MDGEAPRFLLRDRDGKFGSAFDRVAEGRDEGHQDRGASPNMNAIAERFVGSGRREMLDYVIRLGDRHLDWLVRLHTWIQMPSLSWPDFQAADPQPAIAPDTPRRRLYELRPEYAALPHAGRKRYQPI